jgi:hypothetical protein
MHTPIRPVKNARLTPRQNGSVGLGAGRNPLFLRGSHFVPCCVLQVQVMSQLIYKIRINPK